MKIEIVGIGEVHAAASVHSCAYHDAMGLEIRRISLRYLKWKRKCHRNDSGAEFDWSRCTSAIELCGGSRIMHQITASPDSFTRFGSAVNRIVVCERKYALHSHILILLKCVFFIFFYFIFDALRLLRSPFLLFFYIFFVHLLVDSVYWREKKEERNM